MNKFKKWLILKLGGYISPKITEIKYLTNHDIMIPLAVERIVDKNEREYLGAEVDEYVKRELTEKLAEALVNEDLLNITITPNHFLDHESLIYRAGIIVVKEPKDGTVF